MVPVKITARKKLKQTERNKCQNLINFFKIQTIFSLSLRFLHNNEWLIYPYLYWM